MKINENLYCGFSRREVLHIIVLGIDTSVKTASAAIVNFDENRKILASATANSSVTHSENLLPMIDYMLKSSGLTLDDIDIFGTVVGPGSFTGLRIGISTIKGLAFREKNSCVAVSSLDALAKNCFSILKTLKNEAIIWQNDIFIAPCIDARRKQVYNSLYVFNKSGYKKIKSDRIITCENLEKELVFLNGNYNSDKIIVFCGDGAELCMNEINLPFNKIAVENTVIAVSVCDIAFEKYNSDINIGTAINPSELSPEYLLKTQAERELNSAEEIAQ